MDAQGRTDVETFLDGLDGNFESSINGILVLLERYSLNGPDDMNDVLCHLADRKEKIWEFIKGRLRIYWFDAGDAVIVCVCGCVKKTQRVDPAMVKKAIQVKHEYLRLKGAGVNVEIVEED